MIAVNEQSRENVFVFGSINTFKYTNWKGETEERKVIPLCLRFGSLKCVTAKEGGFKGYDEPQWLLECIAADRPNESGITYRTFALKNIRIPYFDKKEQ